MHIPSFLVFILALASASASASLLHISGSGTWAGSVATTDITAPGLSWTLSFDVDNPIPTASIDTSPVALYNAVYTLDGNQVGSADSAIFYTAANDGMFSVYISGINWNHELAFYGDQVVNEATGELLAGQYSGQADVDLSNPGIGHGAANITISAASSVPEPASLALFGLGLVGLGWVRRKENK